MNQFSSNQKQIYREQALDYRRKIPKRNEDFENIINVFFDFFNRNCKDKIACYFPFRDEFDIRFLMDELARRNTPCALPVIENEGKILSFRLWTGQEPLIKNRFGIREPVSGEPVIPDFILAPLLAFDQKGTRLGYGGGYYDATINHYRSLKEIIYVGVGYAEQAVLFNLPHEAHDIRLDYMMTPQGVIEFGE